VVAERLDKTIMSEKPVELPCLGVFDMEHGKIKAWRDYFYFAAYMKALDKLKFT